jgi:hypothetical protein
VFRARYPPEAGEKLGRRRAEGIRAPPAAGHCCGRIIVKEIYTTVSLTLEQPLERARIEVKYDVLQNLKQDTAAEFPEVSAGRLSDAL